jgi:hypothetical protein
MQRTHRDPTKVALTLASFQFAIHAVVPSARFKMSAPATSSFSSDVRQMDIGNEKTLLAGKCRGRLGFANLRRKQQ